MKPNFALDLSHDGISLLHRSKGGWTLVGSVALHAPDLGTQLNALRQTAGEIEPDDVHCKLIIPNSQILYTTVEATGPDDIAREVQIRAALDGLTPYPVGDLVFDWRAEGTQARVAVLARETMDEAEAFAVEYNFNPVSFAARPESDSFSGEPFFGKTRAASQILGTSARVTPDATPVPKRPRDYTGGEAPAQNQTTTSAPIIPTGTPAVTPAAPRSETVAQTAPSPQTPSPLDADPFNVIEDAVQDNPDPFSEVSPDATFSEKPTLESGYWDEREAEGTAVSDDGEPFGSDDTTFEDTAEAVEAPLLAPFPPTPEDMAAAPPARPKPSAKKRRQKPIKAPEKTASEKDTSGPISKSADDIAPPPVLPVDGASPPATAGPEMANSPTAATANVEDQAELPVSPADAPPATEETPKTQVSKGLTLDLDASKRVSPPSSPKSGEDSTGDVPPAFSTRRSGAPLAASKDDARPVDRLTGMVPRIGVPDAPKRVATTIDPVPETKLSPEASAPSAAKGNEAQATPGKVPAPAAPPIDKARADMAAALAKPLPRADLERPAATTPAEKPKQTERVAALGKTAKTMASSALAKTGSLIKTVVGKAPTKPTRKTTHVEPAAEGPKEKDAGLRRFGASKKKGKNDAEQERSREADALTIFGARKTQEVGGKPKYLGLILILILLLLMAIVGIWSSVFSDSDDVGVFNPAPDAELSDPLAPAPTTPSGETSASGLPAETPPVTPDTAPTGEVLSQSAAETRYAATGIWQRSPDPLAEPETPRLENLDIDGLGQPLAHKTDRAAETQTTPVEEQTFGNPLAPPPPGTTFNIGADGLVRPSQAGTLSPAGIMIYSGKPPKVPPSRPGTAEVPAAPTDAAPQVEEPEAQSETTPEAAPEASLPPSDIPSRRPPPRPANLVPDNAALEAASPADPRPAVRPEELVVATTSPSISEAIGNAVEDAVQSAFATSSDLAVPASPKPRNRPRNFGSIVDKALASASDGNQVVAAAAAVPTAAPRAAPSIPSSASVASRATMKNAINLRELNLIGVYGTAKSRRALVRMTNGRYVKVKVGDRLNGGTVTSISSSRLIYQKSGKAYALDVLPLG